MKNQIKQTEDIYFLLKLKKNYNTLKTIVYTFKQKILN